jgi:hypothetical protein
MSETHLRFRSTGGWNPFLLVTGFQPEIDGVRVQDDGEISITLGKRILQTSAANISGIDLVDKVVFPIGVRRLPASRAVAFVTATGPGVRLTFRTQVRPVAGIFTHTEATLTIEDANQLLPAVLAARNATKDP